jgi:hypothetical protein
MVDLDNIKEKLEKLPGLLAYELEKKRILDQEKIRLENEIKLKEADSLFLYSSDKRYNTTEARTICKIKLRDEYNELARIKSELTEVDTKIEIFNIELSATQSLIKLLQIEKTL